MPSTGCARRCSAPAGCPIWAAAPGHSYAELAPRETVGVDVEPAALAGQDLETRAADMRELPFAENSFASVVSIQSIEHVPDPDRVLTEVARVLAPDGRAIFVTPNRLTFGRPDEIIDPYHYVEYDAGQLRELCARHFASVDIQGLQVHRAPSGSTTTSATSSIGCSDSIRYGCGA